MVQVHSPSLIGVWLNRHSNGLQNRHLEVRILPLLHILTWRRWWRIRLISGRWKVQILLSGLARSSIGRAPDSDSGCCRFESCRACCGHCIMAVPQTVDLKVRVRFPLVTPYCRRLTDKPPHYGCGTGGSNPLGSAICIAQRMRALPSEGRGRGFKSHYRYLSVSPNWTRHGSSKPAR